MGKGAVSLCIPTHDVFSLWVASPRPSTLLSIERAPWSGGCTHLILSATPSKLIPFQEKKEVKSHCGPLNRWETESQRGTCQSLYISVLELLSLHGRREQGGEKALPENLLRDYQGRGLTGLSGRCHSHCQVSPFLLAQPR